MVGEQKVGITVKLWFPFKCQSGGMVYTLVLGTSASRLVGSSPTFGTKNCSSNHEGRENIKPFNPIGEVVDKYLYINTARVIKIQGKS